MEHYEDFFRSLEEVEAETSLEEFIFEFWQNLLKGRAPALQKLCEYAQMHYKAKEVCLLELPPEKGLNLPLSLPFLSEKPLAYLKISHPERELSEEEKKKLTLLLGGLYLQTEIFHLFESLLETLAEINATRQIEKLLTQMVDKMVELSKAERGLLLLPKKSGWEVRVARERNQKNLLQEKLSFSHTLVEEAYKTQKALCVQDIDAMEEDLKSASVAELKLQAMLAIPLFWKGKCQGVLYLDSHARNPRFSSLWLPFFQILGSQLALALENAKREAELKELNRQLEQLVKKKEDELEHVKQELFQKKRETDERYRFGNLVGKSAKMQKLYRLLEQVAPSDVPVLIVGESGTGKELIAKAIHFHSSRRHCPIISENCAAVNEKLLESELFGHVKGAFTGASSSRKGLFELANGGTLFLDEVGEMSLAMQTKLLRVLQEREIRPVGGTKTIPVDVRIIAATNRNLQEMVKEGTFREDLYYRLCVVTISVPPLRERKEDIPLLIQHFLMEHGGFSEKEAKQLVENIPSEVKQNLFQYDWPGNVRELENGILRLLALGKEELDWTLLLPRSDSLSLQKKIRPLTEVEKEAIERALQATQGNKQLAAKLLGISRKTLYNKLRQYGIKD